MTAACILLAHFAAPSPKMLRSFTDTPLPYQLFLPPRQASSSALLPVLVHLHGSSTGPFAAQRAQSLPGLLARNSSFAAGFRMIGLFPCCSCDARGEARRPPHKLDHTCWYRGSTGRRNLALLLELVASVVLTHGGDPQRVSLTGQSAGAVGVVYAAAAAPSRWASLVPICVAHKPSSDFTRAINKSCACAPASRRCACAAVWWVFHSADDAQAPVGWGDELVAQLRRSDPHRRTRLVRYTRYETAPPGTSFAIDLSAPGSVTARGAPAGHGSFELAYREPGLHDWLLRQSCEPRGECGFASPRVRTH